MLIHGDEITMVRKAAFYNAPPSERLSPGAPSDAVKVEFARRLQRALIELGWNQAELARRATKHLPGEGRIMRDNISKYIRAKVLPQPHILNAICKALDRKPEELLPTRGVPSAGGDNPPLDVRDIGEGMVWLKVNQATSWVIALQILKLLKGEAGDQ